MSPFRAGDSGVKVKPSSHPPEIGGGKHSVHSSLPPVETFMTLILHCFHLCNTKVEESWEGQDLLLVDGCTSLD